jgi:hypothetical protein
LSLPDFPENPSKKQNFGDGIGFKLTDSRRLPRRLDSQKLQSEVWKTENQLSKILTEANQPERNSPLASNLQANKQALRLGVYRG